MRFRSQSGQSLHNLKVISNFDEDKAAAGTEGKADSSDGVIVLDQLFPLFEDGLVVSSVLTFLANLL